MQEANMKSASRQSALSSSIATTPTPTAAAASSAATTGKYFAHYNNSWDCFNKIRQQYGMRGIFQGLPATFLRNIPGSAVYFGSYDFLRIQMLKFSAHSSTSSTTEVTPPPQELSARHVIMAGGLAGVLYWIAVYPFDVIKSSMQTDHLDPASRRYRSIMHCATSIYKA
jgi:solute carrier family 25 carnitine/acylcarnitine transporter 20/29